MPGDEASGQQLTAESETSAQELELSKEGVARPFLKGAGGKTQLLPVLLPKVPARYRTYIEPFFGGGALFFALRPSAAVIADSNPELINLYRTVADDVDSVIRELEKYRNTEEMFLETRNLEWQSMEAAAAAARTIYLNKTCFNGLYRVNRAGRFNVPFGHHQNPKILDEDTLRAASIALRGATIRLGDYSTVLHEEARPGDFVFLDPPYVPIGTHSDFRRYTKEQFSDEDHRRLAEEVHRLVELGCHVVLTNSNHPLVHDLFGQYNVEVIKSKRHINSNGNKRTGEDVVVTAKPLVRKDLRHSRPQPISEQAGKFPPTRYMGSKSKLLRQIWGVASQFECDSVVDLFGGSGAVSYMFKSQGKRVVTNDYMAFAAVYAKAMIENNDVILTTDEAFRLVDQTFDNDGFVSRTFRGLYYTDEDNAFIDSVRAGIETLRNPYKRAIAKSALIRSCIKKRPRGIFTYVGHRYDDGRKDLTVPFRQHFLDAVNQINGAVFDNGERNISRCGDAMTVRPVSDSLVYMDPPYYSPHSDNEYVRRYHFVEGLARNWEGVEIQAHTITKKFKSYPTPFSTKEGAVVAFDRLFKRFSDNVLVVSYSSNGLPTLNEIVAMMYQYKSNVEVVPVNHKYSFGNQAHRVGDNRNTVQEYLFVGY